MGDMADFFTDHGEPDEMAQPDADSYLEMTDGELRESTKKTRSNKIKGIRNWKGKLSNKQRWCLANWLAEQETRFIERNLK